MGVARMRDLIPCHINAKSVPWRSSSKFLAKVLSHKKLGVLG